MTHPRLDFADNIRTLLICQVIMVHAAVTYGGEGGWYFEEPTQDMTSIIGLTLFNALSQSFFMSLLFLLAGFFSWMSLQRSSTGSYVVGRLKRLGIPLLAFYVGIGPLTNWIALTMEGNDNFEYIQSFHAGPMWFAQALLIFTGVYLLVRLIRPSEQSTPQDIRFSWLPVVLFILLLWLVTIPARAIWPMGQGIAGMQLGSFGHYSLMFALGIIAASTRWDSWLETIDSKKLWVAAIAGVIALPVGLALGFDADTEFAPFMGGFSWQAIFYDGWESMMCVLLSILVLRTLYRATQLKGGLWRAMGRANYGVYFLHPPILLLATWVLLPLALAPLVKFAIATTLTILVAFPLAWLLTRLPVVRDIL